MMTFATAQRFTTTVLPLIALLATAWSTPVTADEPPAKEYPIRLELPTKLTEKYDLSVTCSREVKTVITRPGEKDVKPTVETLAIQLDATLEPLVVDTKGHPTKISCTIKKLSRTDAKDPAELLPAGSVVVIDATGKDPAAKKGEPYYTMNRVELKGDALEAMQLGVTAKLPESPTDDECYGTTAKQKIGATWPIDVAKAGKDPAWELWSLAADHSKAKMTLVSVEPIDGKDWIKTALDISSDKFTGPPSPGQTIEKANVHTTSVVSTPLDATSPHEKGMSDVTIEMSSKETANGQSYDLQSTTRVRADWRITPH